MAGPASRGFLIIIDVCRVHIFRPSSSGTDTYAQHQEMQSQDSGKRGDV